MTYAISDREHPEEVRRSPGKRIACVEMGEGDPIVYLHGNPTSSYLWRNVMPHTEALGRSIAIDLIGMGDSDRLEDSGPDRYRFVEHREYLDAALDALGVTAAGNAVLVVHDWGSALGFDWANRNRDAVRGLVYMEALVRAGDVGGMARGAAAGCSRGSRSEAGEDMVLAKNIFVERVLPGSIQRDLTPEEMEGVPAPPSGSRENRAARPSPGRARSPSRESRPT